MSAPQVKTIQAHQLKMGDWFLCPSTGRAERVTGIHRAASMAGDVPRTFVRTTTHDHIRPRTSEVTLTERPDWAKP
jgi:hypothetical protein